MKRTIITIIIALITIFILTLSINMASNASPGGKGDDSREYNCVNSCHKKESEKTTMRMESGTNSLRSGEDVSVTVTVQNSEQAEGELIGVFLVSELEATRSKPSDDGWTIVEDPNGGTNNYVEKPADSTGSATFTWKLKSPEKPGEYTLYSREDHGNGEKYFKDYTDGVVINVIQNPEIPDDKDDKEVNDDIDNTENIIIDNIGNSSTNNTNDNGNGFLVYSGLDFLPLLLGLIIAAVIVIITQVLKH
ncbi:MAG: hypothetical protein JSV49_10175 [Thermoplasmata archaeon]|nr:MAG: hypothetical protein JSV49_10175 [Thermoplasmata archaeon]